MTRRLKVGELARRSGVTVRALHWYEQIGLLAPQRSEAGYRLYDAVQIERLHAIVSLRALGLSLDDVRTTLDSPLGTLGEILDRQMQRLEVEIRARQRLREQLRALRAGQLAGSELPIEDLLTTMEMMAMIDRHYTEEQLTQLARRREQLGEARIHDVEARWPRLIAEVQAAVAAGEDPTSLHGVALAREWNGLIAVFTGGDPGIRAALQRLYDSEPHARARTGLDPAVAAWIARASEAVS